MGQRQRQSATKNKSQHTERREKREMETRRRRRGKKIRDISLNAGMSAGRIPAKKLKQKEATKDAKEYRIYI